MRPKVPSRACTELGKCPSWFWCPRTLQLQGSQEGCAPVRIIYWVSLLDPQWLCRLLGWQLPWEQRRWGHLWLESREAQMPTDPTLAACATNAPGVLSMGTETLTSILFASHRASWHSQSSHINTVQCLCVQRWCSVFSLQFLLQTWAKCWDLNTGMSGPASLLPVHVCVDCSVKGEEENLYAESSLLEMLLLYHSESKNRCGNFKNLQCPRVPLSWPVSVRNLWSITYLTTCRYFFWYRYVLPQGWEDIWEHVYQVRPLWVVFLNKI